MSGELGALIRGAEAGWEQVEAGKELDQVGRGRLIGRARRTRAVRAGAVAAAAVVLVAAAGGGALLLSRPAPVPPVDTHTVPPSPSPTASETPTPTPTPTPTSTASAPPNPGFAGTVTLDPHLPSAQAITPEVWAKAGSGWVLASYRELGYTAGSPIGPQVVYLVSPQGVRYQLTEVPGDQVVQVLAWAPGRATAVALAHPVAEQQADVWDGSTTWVSLDLVTGATAPLAVDAPAPRAFDAMTQALPDGRVPIGGGRAVDPTGAVSTLPAPDPSIAAAVAARYPDHTQCGTPVRYDAHSSVVLCTTEAAVGDDDSPLAPYLLQVRDDGQVVVLASPTKGAGPEPARTPSVVGGVVLTSGSTDWSPYGCPTGLYRLDAGAFTPLPGVLASSFPSPNIFTVAGVSGSAVYTRVTAGCSGDARPETVVRDDLSSGAHVELVPYPADGDGAMASLSGLYVVP